MTESMSPKFQLEQFKLVVVTLMLHIDIATHTISRFERVMILANKKETLQ